MNIQVWLLQVCNNPRFVAPSMEPHHLCINGWCFWSVIFQKTLCPSPPNGTRKTYKITMDWKGNKYAGIDINFDYMPFHKTAKPASQSNIKSSTWSVNLEKPNQSRLSSCLTWIPPFLIGPPINSPSTPIQAPRSMQRGYSVSIFFSLRYSIMVAH